MDRTDTPYSSKEIVSLLKIGDSTLRKWCLSLEEQNYSFIRTDQNKRMFTEKDLLVLSQFKLLVQDKNLSINNAAAVVASKYVKEPFSNETEVEQLPTPPFSNETEVEQLLALPFFNETLQELKTELMNIHRTEIEQLNKTYSAGIVQLTDVYRTEIEQLKKENKNEVEQLKEMNKRLLSRLEEQHKYIENRFNATDQRIEEKEKRIEGDSRSRDQLLMQSIREAQETKKLLLEIQEQQQQKKPRKGIMKWFTKE